MTCIAAFSPLFSSGVQVGYHWFLAFQKSKEAYKVYLIKAPGSRGLPLVLEDQERHLNVINIVPGFRGVPLVLSVPEIQGSLQSISNQS